MYNHFHKNINSTTDNNKKMLYKKSAYWTVFWIIMWLKTGVMVSLTVVSVQVALWLWWVFAAVWSGGRWNRRSTGLRTLPLIQNTLHIIPAMPNKHMEGYDLPQHLILCTQSLIRGLVTFNVPHGTDDWLTRHRDEGCIFFFQAWFAVQRNHNAQISSTCNKRPHIPLQI